MLFLCVMLFSLASCGEKDSEDDSQKVDTEGLAVNGYIIKIDGKEMGYLSSQEDIAKLEPSATRHKFALQTLR